MQAWHIQPIKYFLKNKGTAFSVHEKTENGSKRNCSFLKEKLNIIDDEKEDAEIETLEINEEFDDTCNEEASLVSIDNEDLSLNEEIKVNEEKSDDDDDFDEESDEDDNNSNSSSSTKSTTNKTSSNKFAMT